MNTQNINGYILELIDKYNGEVYCLLNSYENRHDSVYTLVKVQDIYGNTYRFDKDTLKQLIKSNSIYVLELSLDKGGRLRMMRPPKCAKTLGEVFNRYRFPDELLKNQTYNRVCVLPLKPESDFEILCTQKSYFIIKQKSQNKLYCISQLNSNTRLQFTNAVVVRGRLQLNGHGTIIVKDCVPEIPEYIDNLDAVPLSNIHKLLELYNQNVNKLLEDDKIVIIEWEDTCATVVNSDGKIDTESGAILNGLIQQISEQERMLHCYDNDYTENLGIYNRKEYFWVNTAFSELLIKLIHDDTDKLKQLLKTDGDDGCLYENHFCDNTTSEISYYQIEEAPDIDFNERGQICSSKILSVQPGRYFDSEHQFIECTICFKNPKTIYEFIQEVLYNEIMIDLVQGLWLSIKVDDGSDKDIRIDKCCKADETDLDGVKWREKAYRFKIEDLNSPGDVIRKLSIRQLIAGILRVDIETNTDEQLIQQFIKEFIDEIQRNYTIDAVEAFEYLERFLNEKADAVDKEYIEHEQSLYTIMNTLAYSNRVS